MKPHELFGVVVRSIGLLTILYSLVTTCLALFALLGNFGQALALGILSFAGLAAGFYLFLRADGIVRSAYPNAPEE